MQRSSMHPEETFGLSREQSARHSTWEAFARPETCLKNSSCEVLNFGGYSQKMHEEERARF